jgi:hypothetical protein
MTLIGLGGDSIKGNIPTLFPRKSGMAINEPLHYDYQRKTFIFVLQIESTLN